MSESICNASIIANYENEDQASFRHNLHMCRDLKYNFRSSVLLLVSVNQLVFNQLLVNQYAEASWRTRIEIPVHVHL